MSSSLPRVAPTTAPDLEPALLGPDLATFSDAALLSVILGPRPGVEPLPLRLVDRFGGLGGVLAADAGELERAGAHGRLLLIVKCLRETLVRAAREEASRRPVISSWSQLLVYVRVSLAERPREQFRVLFLDKRNQLIREELRASGTVDHAPVYNSGPGRVARLGRVPEIRETQAYVQSVLDCFLALTAGRAVANSVQCRPREGEL